jgi:hypothetical protein
VKAEQASKIMMQVDLGNLYRTENGWPCWGRSVPKTRVNSGASSEIRQTQKKERPALGPQLLCIITSSKSTGYLGEFRRVDLAFINPHCEKRS